VENEAEDLQRDDAEQGLVTRLAEDDRRVALALRQADVALGHVALDPGAVGQDEGEPALRSQADGALSIDRQQAVLRAAVHEEINRAREAERPGDDTVDVGQSHRLFPASLYRPGAARIVSEGGSGHSTVAPGVKIG